MHPIIETLSQIAARVPESFLAAVAINVPLIALAYYVFWYLLADRLKAWRIQLVRRANAAQFRRELKNSLYVLFVNAVFAAVLTYYGTQGLTGIYLDVSDHHWSVAVLTFPVLLLFDDAWFYWVHRALHHPALYHRIHHEHHKSLDVNPLTSLSFHWAEPVLLTLWIVPVSLVFPLYAPALAVLQIYGFLDNLKSHLGYEVYPRGLNKSLLRFLTSSTYHNLHHTKFRGNYGVHFRFWDRFMGTELEQYETRYDEIQKAKRDGRPLPAE
ncbi:sterol desaturase/sphingolipid hydroxylase (fatty acid hydroxylase superfamily) [Litoreibacter ponti]|uniref:Sterol desaturase/sphingolipid hydroxylase (Fatty acid hydroxylase superfamily) n=1 Tax=Litoreibacter ponti TaxID=1510457 RepID=A0A2T6BCJ8_9RHOB|nr:sterol desaturase family protein [Litoreibacter ponti]PTX53798.1 sterol desaturase/sphingolipid hydroxylase (fatty acid hydroxylase superfamily) [Litoreibacter ponti]